LNDISRSAAPHSLESPRQGVESVGRTLAGLP